MAIKLKNVDEAFVSNKKTPLRAIVGVLLAIIFLAAVIGCAYFYKQYRALKAEPSIQAREQSAEVLKDLGQIMVLPKDANPVFATVTDKTKLGADAFMKNAENGDMIIVFTSEMRAVLYRPSTKQIVNIAPVAPQDATAQPTKGTTPEPTDTSTTTKRKK